uniref:Major head protein n=1 Tax=Rhizobium phage IG49 TaxID=3129228 RepID=A0AAU8HYK4_9CAUD
MEFNQYGIYNEQDMELEKKWKKVIDADGAPKIASEDLNMRYGMARLLENTFTEIKLERESGVGMFAESTPTTQTGGIAKWDPILISMVRRIGQTILSNRLVGNQPMTGPSGLIFAVRPRYENQQGPEVLTGAPKTAFTGFNSAGNPGWDLANEIPSDVALDPFAKAQPADPFGTGFTTGFGMDTATGEGDVNSELTVTIDSARVDAKTRSSKASYSMETAQDMARQHGMNADAFLTSILADNIAAETYYEILRSMYISAKLGCTDTSTPGVYDLNVDSSGGWIAEKARTLALRIIYEASEIMATTRAGYGTFAVVDRKTYNLLQGAGLISDYGPSNNMMTGADPIIRNNVPNSGLLFGQLEVYRDDYAQFGAREGFCMVGFKGANEADAAMYHCPYIPVWTVRAVDPKSGQPMIFFKKRYGVAANPLADTEGKIVPRSNPLLRIFKIQNIEI